MTMSRYTSIAVSGPLRRTFTYRVPSGFGNLLPGQRVLVPFGRSRKVGFLLGDTKPPADVHIKDIIRPIDIESRFCNELFRFCLWMADYYFANPADCLMAALPPAFKKNIEPRYLWSDSGPGSLPDSMKSLYKRGGKLTRKSIEKIEAEHPDLLSELLNETTITEHWPEDQTEPQRQVEGYRAAAREIWDRHFERRKQSFSRFDDVRSRARLRSEGWTDYHIRTAANNGALEPVYAEGSAPILDFIEPRENLRGLILNPEQQVAFRAVEQNLSEGFKPFLLHGVTGSGKTIVYCHICREAVRRGKTALVLTPEIALTSTTLAYFRGFFGDRVTVIHSAMTDRERLDSWRGIQKGEFNIVLGPRSAIFAPLTNLGVIIVDEEHDGSYKQDDPAPRFHGRDSAIMRAKMANVPVVLGSASPSMESFHHAREGRYRLLRLTQRPKGASLPVVRIVDMKTDRLRGDLPYLSYSLKKAVQARLMKNEQVILYLNRRGHSPQLKCVECGLVSKCPNCRVNLTYHRVGGKLSCHYCGHMLGRYDRCPSCGGHDFLYLGVGTQKVEENIPRLFEGVTAVRLDSDSASGRKKAYQILTGFASGSSNMLLGTQMVTKGLDLPNVTLVGVLSADQSLDWPDFRASEKAFARLLQVAGRSGRSENPGEVFIQTYYPEHEVVCDAARQDYDGFFDREIASRKDLSYPPFTRLVNFVLSGSKEDKLRAESLDFRSRLSETINRSAVKATVLGPAPCPMYRLRGRYRRHLFIKTAQIVKFVRGLYEWESRESRFKLPSSIRLTVDVDPDDMM
ncbi:MAG: primosomal protein N' [Candidatus Zixiibacteriota bacterium]|nr:MAG: primosomal protein N' [candidate division Zixibacteria bacterium]